MDEQFLSRREEKRHAALTETQTEKCHCSPVDRIVADNDGSKPIAERVATRLENRCNQCGGRVAECEEQ